MAKDKTGLKDKVAGKFKEVEGKITGDKMREAEGKAQQVKGKAKGTINDVKENIKCRKNEEVT